MRLGRERWTVVALAAFASLAASGAAEAGDELATESACLGPALRPFDEAGADMASDFGPSPLPKPFDRLLGPFAGPAFLSASAECGVAQGSSAPPPDDPGPEEPGPAVLPSVPVPTLPAAPRPETPAVALPTTSLPPPPAASVPDAPTRADLDASAPPAPDAAAPDLALRLPELGRSLDLDAGALPALADVFAPRDGGPRGGAALGAWDPGPRARDAPFLPGPGNAPAWPGSGRASGTSVAPGVVVPAASPRAGGGGAPASLLWGVGAAAFLLVPAWALFQRLSRDRLLDAPLRQRVLDEVRRRPGASVQDLARALGVHFTTVKHHVQVLEENGFLSVQRVRARSACFVPGDAFTGTERTLLAVASRRTAWRALCAAASSSGATTADLAREIGVSFSGTLWHLRRFTAEGLVAQETGDDGQPRWHVPAEVKEAVARFEARSDARDVA